MRRKVRVEPWGIYILPMCGNEFIYYFIIIKFLLIPENWCPFNPSVYQAMGWFTDYGLLTLDDEMVAADLAELPAEVLKGLEEARDQCFQPLVDAFTPWVESCGYGRKMKTVGTNYITFLCLIDSVLHTCGEILGDD